MRDDYSRSTTSLLWWIICTMVGGFILQSVVRLWIPGVAGGLEGPLALSTVGIHHWHLWTLVTYSALSGGVLHLLGNALSLYFLFRVLRGDLGEHRILWLLLAGVVVGGLLWTAVHFAPERAGACIGASAGVMALLTVYALLYPNETITLLLFFVLPVSVKPKWVLIILLGFSTLGLLIGELGHGQGFGGIAHSAHLGGALAGWLYIRYVHGAEWKWRHRAKAAVDTEIELPKWMRKSRPAGTPPPAYKVNMTDRDALKAEVDRILDKISSQGFEAITAEEKRILDSASDLLNRK